MTREQIYKERIVSDKLDVIAVRLRVLDIERDELEKEAKKLYAIRELIRDGAL